MFQFIRVHFLNGESFSLVAASSVFPWNPGTWTSEDRPLTIGGSLTGLLYNGPTRSGMNLSPDKNLPRRPADITRFVRWPLRGDGFRVRLDRHQTSSLIFPQGHAVLHTSRE